MNSQSTYIKVLRKSNWTQAKSGELPARVILWKPDDEIARHSLDTEKRYATHIEVENERGNYFFGGHYDMQRGAAEADFGNRCRQLGVSEDVVIGGMVR